MTTTTPTSTELRAKSDADQEQLHLVREARNRAGEAYVRGDIDSSALAQANADVTAAEFGAATTSVALEKALAADAERERTAERAELLTQAATVEKDRRASMKRLRAALDNARAALAGYDEANDHGATVRAGIVALRDVDAEAERIRQKYAERYDEMRRNAPPGMVPNETTLEGQLDAEIKILHDFARAEAEDVSRPPDATELDTIASDFADALPRLVAPDVRRALAQGTEFVHLPQVDSPFGGRGNSSRRIYTADEGPEAMRRYEALREALELLGGPPAETIGQIANRHGRGSKVA